MSPSDHIRNKLRETSDDERLARTIERVSGLLASSEAEYAVIGSCGLQSYLPCFYRLPNDLDLVLAEEGAKRVLEGALERGWAIIDQLGRGKLIVDDFPIHLIPQRMAVIDKSTNHIFTFVDLSGEFPAVTERKMNLIGSSRAPSLRVASLESILFIEMIRPIYTGSAMSIALVLRDNDFSERAMAGILKANPPLAPIILDRVKALPAVIDRMATLSESERTSVAEKLVALREAFERVDP